MFNFVYSLKDRINTTKVLLPILISTIVIVIVILIFAVRAENSLIISNIEIENTNIVPTSHILEYFEFDVIGKEKSSIDLVVIKQKIETHPYIQNAEVLFKQSNVLYVKIIEETPIAILRGKNGDLSYLSQTGRMMPYTYQNNIINLPVISGWDNSERTKKMALNYATKIINIINEMNNDYMLYISEFVWNSQSRSYDFLSNDIALKVKFGRADDIQGKLEKYLKYYEKMQTLPELAKVEYIDLRWENQIVIKN